MSQIDTLTVHDSNGVTADISDRVINHFDIDLSLDLVSQITFEISDPGLELMAENYFQLRRPITYLGMNFEMASLNVHQSTGGESIVVEARSAPCQRLKRDKGAKTFPVGSATAFAALMARNQGMAFFGEPSASKGRIARVSNTTTDESSWDVLKRLASENHFAFFETDNRLFFATEQFMLGKFAIVGTGVNSGFLATPIRWLSDDTGPIVSAKPQIPLPSSFPTLALNSPYAAQVQFLETVLIDRAGQPLAVDGVYSATVVQSVKNLQAFFKLAVTGVVDAATWSVIRFLAGPQATVSANYSVRALSCPDVRQSDDDVNAATLMFSVEQDVGRLFRPGMTVSIVDIPNFKTNFIINNVKWAEGTNTPVSISARTPQVPSDVKVAASLRSRLDLTGGGFNTITVPPDLVLAA